MKDSENKDMKPKLTKVILFKTIIFYLLFILSIPLTAIGMILIHLINYKASFTLCRLWGKFVNSMLRYINNVKIVFKPANHLIDEPTLFIANHTGPWETVALMPYIPVNYTYILKKQLLSWKYNFFALGLSTLEPIGIKRESNAGDFTTMKEEGEKRFKKNIHVLIFPGGTRKPLHDSINFGPGGILLAKKLKCNIQPIFIDSECWARGKYIKDYGVIFPGEMKIVFGNLIKKEDVINKKAKELQIEIEAFLTSNL